MSWTDEELGTLERVPGGVRGRLERVIEHSPDEIWAALTDPTQLPQWLAPGEIALTPGGAARLNFIDSGTVIDSVVTAVEAPRLLEYSWSSPGEPDRPVRWETTPEGDATRVNLTVTIPEGEDAGRACAGWVAHLEMLAAALEGAPMKFPFDRFKAAREVYKARLA